MMSRTRRTVWGWEIPKNGPKMLPEPFRQAPPKMLQKWSKNAPKMVPKWSLDALLTLFIWKNNREPEGGAAAEGRRPPSGGGRRPPLYYFPILGVPRGGPGTIFETFLKHFWSIWGGACREGSGSIFGPFLGIPRFPTA